MRHVKTRKGGRIVFGRVEWVVIPIGSREPCGAGANFYADKYYEDRMQMPLWNERRSGLANPDAYAHRADFHVMCGKIFLAATRDEAKALGTAHAAECAECKAEEAKS